MANQPVPQRLAAILFADVVGYAKLMDADEAGTYSAWRGARSDVVEPSVAAHRGRIVKFTGDGFLAEFPSAESALSCAIKMQEGFVQRDTLKLRIGVHVGDVYSEGDDVYGDGVNIAARLEGLAEAGGICISGTVHDVVRKKIAVAFEDGGKQALKHIDQPVQVWRVRPATEPRASLSATPEAILRRAAIAVLPFANMSGDPEQEYFADGLTEDLITELSRSGALFVIARNSTFVYKGRATNVCDIARELRVHFVLEGSVRKSAQRIRVTAQLIDGTTGGHLWAERFDRDLTDIFAVQDEITHSIVSALALNISMDVHKPTVLKGTNSIEAYDLFLKGRELLWQLTRSSNAEAKTLLERAIALDPAFALAHANLAHVHLLLSLNQWGADPAESERRALELAETAIRLNAFDPNGYWMVAAVFLWKKEYERALTMTQRALTLDPCFFTAYSTLSGALLGLGRAEEALQVLETAARADPHAPSIKLHYRARALFLLGRFDEAVTVLKERIARSPETDVSRALLASAYGHLCKMEEAKAAWTDLLKVNPSYSLEMRRKVLSDHEFERLAAGLGKAGLVVRLDQAQHSQTIL